MAIATLSELYNNHYVFTGVVKIRKGLACKLILESSNISGVHNWFHSFAQSILSRVPSKDPNAAQTIAICEKIIQLTQSKARLAKLDKILRTINMCIPIFIAIGAHQVLQSPTIRWKKLSEAGVLNTTQTTRMDLMWMLLVICSVLYTVLYASFKKLSTAKVAKKPF
eukprot:gene3322-6576_t